MIPFRTPLLLVACAFSVTLHAQPAYSVYITGVVQDCQAGSSLYLETGPGVTPVTSEVLGPLFENNGECHFSTSWLLNDTVGSIGFWTICGNGDTAQATGYFDVNLTFDTATMLVYVDCDGSSAVNGPAWQEPPSVLVFSGNDGTATLRLTGFEPGKYRSSLWDTSGRLLDQGTVQATSSRIDFPLRTGPLAPGLYTVEVAHQAHGARARFVVE